LSGSIFLVDIGTFHSPHDIINIPDSSRRDTIISPPHLKQIIKSIERVENKTPLQVQVKNYEDLRSKYNKKLREENTSSTDLTKPILQDEAALVKEKWLAQCTTKEGAMLMITLFFIMYAFCILLSV